MQKAFKMLLESKIFSLKTLLVILKSVPNQSFILKLIFILNDVTDDIYNYNVFKYDPIRPLKICYTVLSVA